MTIRYPNGRTFNHEVFETKKQSKKATIDFAKRGMNFEEEINQSNEYYLAKKIAVVHKKPTPVQIVHVDYPARNRAKITEAYFRTASTTDYNGVYNGMYLDFEAKETKNKTSFPFSNFHQHQITHMETVLNQKGVAFVLLYFSTLSRIFFYPATCLIDRFNAQGTARKSIPLSEVEKEGIEIPFGISPRVPYIEALDTYLKIR